MSVIVSISPGLDEILLADLFPPSAPTGTTAVRLFHLHSDQTEQLDELIEQIGQDHAVAFYSRIEHYIASKLRSGVSLFAAAGEWLKLTNRIIELHKKNRKKLFLINAELWSERPELWPSQLNEIGISPQLRSGIVPIVDLSLLVACQFSKQTVELQKINETLIACSLPLTGEDITLNLQLDDVLHNHFVMQQQIHQQNDANILMQMQLQQALKARKYAESVNSTAEQNFQQLQQQCALQLSKLKNLLNTEIQKNTEADIKFSECMKEIEVLKNERQILLSNSETLERELNQRLIDKNEKFSEVNAYSSSNALEPISIQNNETIETKENVKKNIAPQDSTRLEEENHQLIGQIFKLQEHLEKYYLDIKKIKKKFTVQSATVRKNNTLLKTAIKLLRCIANDPVSIPDTLLTDLATVLESELFDPIWYHKKYMSEESSAVDAAEHFLLQGTKFGYNPGPNFDTNVYLITNVDVATAKANPLLHYERYGRTEGRVIQGVAHGAA